MAVSLVVSGALAIAVAVVSVVGVAPPVAVGMAGPSVLVALISPTVVGVRGLGIVGAAATSATVSVGVPGAERVVGLAPRLAFLLLLRSVLLSSLLEGAAR